MARPNFNFQSGCSAPRSAAPLQEPIPNVSQLVQRLDTVKIKSPIDAYKVIPRNKIRMNLRNNYPIIEMEKLEYLILLYGVIQDISVVYSVEEDIYIIESGHRRVTALDNLINRYKDWNGDSQDANYQLYLKNIRQYESGYVCKVLDRLPEDVSYDSYSPDDLEHTPASVIDSEIRLIIGNEGSRTTTPAVKAQNIKRLSLLLEYQNKGRQRDEKLNVNKVIADKLGISARQVINYKNIDKLIPELRTMFDDGRLTLRDGAAIARLSVTEQEEIFRNMSDGKSVSTELRKEKETKKRQTARKLQIAGESSPDMQADTVRDVSELNNILTKRIQELQKLLCIYQQQLNSLTQHEITEKRLLSIPDITQQLVQLCSGETASPQSNL